MARALSSIVALFLAAFLSLPALSQATVAPAAQTELSKQGVSLKVDILSPTKGAAPNVSDLLRDPGYAKTLDNFQQIKRGVWTTNGLGTSLWATPLRTNDNLTGMYPTAFAAYNCFVANTTTGGLFNFSGVSPPPKACNLVVNHSQISDGATFVAWQLINQDGTFLDSVVGSIENSGGSDVWLNQNPNGQPPEFAVFAPNFVVLCPSWQPSPADIANALPSVITTQEPFTWQSLDPGIGTTFKETGSGLPATPISGGRTFGEPTLVCNYSGRCIYGGFTQPHGSFQNQNYILISNFLLYNTFSTSAPPVATDGGYIAMPLNLGTVTAMCPFTLTSGAQVLIVGCENGVAAVTGTDETNFQAIALTNQYGIPNNNCWQQVGTDLFFLATDGIRKFSANDFSFLTSGSQTQLVQNLTTQLNPALIKADFAVWNPPTRELIFWLAYTSDTRCEHALVFNFNGPDPNDPGGSVQTTPIISTRTAPGFSAGLFNSGQLFLGDHPSGTSAQGVAISYSGNTYEGTAIPFHFCSALIPANSPAQEMSNRKFVIMTEGPDQNFTTTAYTMTKMGDNSLQLLPQDSKIFATGTPPSVTDLSTWATGTTTTAPKLFDFDSRGSGRYWALGITGQTDATHNGIDLVGIQSIMTVGGWRQ